MICPKCAAVSPEGSRYCASCGYPLDAAAPAPAVAPVVGPTGQPVAGPETAAPTAPKSKLPWILGGAGLLVVILAFAFGIMPFLASRGKDGGSALKATSSNGSPMLQRTDAGGKPILPRGDAVVEMPPEIRAWLEHLERIERQQRVLVGRQAGEIAGLVHVMAATGGLTGIGDVDALTDPDTDFKAPGQTAAANFGAQVEQQWRALSADFNSLPPPPECIPLRNNYDTALTQTASISVGIARWVQDASQNPTQALGELEVLRAQGSGKEQIDQFRAETDKGVAELCAKYQTQKWFDIPADISVGGSLLGKT